LRFSHIVFYLRFLGFLTDAATAHDLIADLLSIFFAIIFIQGRTGFAHFSIFFTTTFLDGAFFVVIIL
jgi:hypothetical protein